MRKHLDINGKGNSFSNCVEQWGNFLAQDELEFDKVCAGMKSLFFCSPFAPGSSASSSSSTLSGSPFSEIARLGLENGKLFPYAEVAKDNVPLAYSPASGASGSYTAGNVYSSTSSISASGAISNSGGGACSNYVSSAISNSAGGTYSNSVSGASSSSSSSSSSSGSASDAMTVSEWEAMNVNSLFGSRRVNEIIDEFVVDYLSGIMAFASIAKSVVDNVSTVLKNARAERIKSASSLLSSVFSFIPILINPLSKAVVVNAYDFAPQVDMGDVFQQEAASLAVENSVGLGAGVYTSQVTQSSFKVKKIDNVSTQNQNDVIGLEDMGRRLNSLLSMSIDSGKLYLRKKIVSHLERGWHDNCYNTDAVKDILAYYIGEQYKEMMIEAGIPLDTYSSNIKGNKLIDTMVSLARCVIKTRGYIANVIELHLEKYIWSGVICEYSNDFCSLPIVGEISTVARWTLGTAVKALHLGLRTGLFIVGAAAGLCLALAGFVTSTLTACVRAAAKCCPSYCPDFSPNCIPLSDWFGSACSSVLGWGRTFSYAAYIIPKPSVTAYRSATFAMQSETPIRGTSHPVIARLIELNIIKPHFFSSMRPNCSGHMREYNFNTANRDCYIKENNLQQGVVSPEISVGYFNLTADQARLVDLWACQYQDKFASTILCDMIKSTRFMQV